MQQIDVRIERLVLEGFDPRQTAALAAAFRGELQTLLERGGLPGARRDVSAARLDGGRFSAPSGAPPESVGAALARAVYAQLTAVTERSVKP